MMSISPYYTVPLIITVVAVILGHVYYYDDSDSDSCNVHAYTISTERNGLSSVEKSLGRDASYVTQSDVQNNNWPKLPAWELPQKNATTPWPALGGNGRDRSNVDFVNNPTWVRPTPRPTNVPSLQRQGPNHSFNVGSYQGHRQENRGPIASSSTEATDDELRELSEVLLNNDVNNAASYVTLNVQSKTTSRSSRDEAPLPLLSIDKQAFKIPSVEKLLQLYNNYVVESNVNENYTPQEKQEEDDLIDTIIDTPVMQHTRSFLMQKGKIGRDLRDFKDVLRDIWFNMYARGGGKVGSSGFEHVFLTEIKNNQISGLHNWIYFAKEERNNQANYLGYMKKIDLGNKGAILKYHFTFRGIDKPVGGMFIGTSPEFEMALYTTCFLLRADKICPLKLNGSKFIIRTYTYRYRGKQLIGSAFPDI